MGHMGNYCSSIPLECLRKTSARIIGTSVPPLSKLPVSLEVNLKKPAATLPHFHARKISFQTVIYPEVLKDISTTL
jgi:hypothetical protein